MLNFTRQGRNTIQVRRKTSTFLHDKFTPAICTKFCHNRLGFVDRITKNIWCIFSTDRHSKHFAVLFQVHLGEPIPQIHSPINMLPTGFQQNHYRSTVSTSLYANCQLQHSISHKTSLFCNVQHRP